MEYRVDLYSIFIILGVVQAIFLSFSFLSKERRKKPHNLYQGLLLISIAACLLEIVLMYTGYIIDVLYLADFSEPFALMLGPFYHLMLLSLAKGSVSRKTLLLHLAFPIFYTLVLLPFYFAPLDVKYNGFISAYHPELPLRSVPIGGYRFFLTNWHTFLVIGSLLLYIFLSVVLIANSFREKAESFWRPVSSALKIMRNGIFQIVSISLLIVAVKIFNKNDTGDHLFAAFASLIVYTTSFSIISGSGFFKQASLNESTKYKSSTLTPDQQEELMRQAQKIMSEKKPFMESNFSLPALAKQLKSSVHILSQTINDGIGKSFFEWVAEYRVEEAKKIIIESPFLKIEEVAEQVGYNSKSSFNTAFKKITGKTPSEFRESIS